MPTALAGMFKKVVVVFATALAAMAAVPRVEVRLETDSLPIWNMPFSISGRDAHPVRILLG